MRLLHYARRRADITLTASLHLDDVLLCVSSHTCVSERVPSIPFAPSLYPALVASVTSISGTKELGDSLQIRDALCPNGLRDNAVK